MKVPVGFSRAILTAFVVVSSFEALLIRAFSLSRSDNVVAYWGQDSAGSQQRLSFYCQDDSVDVIPLAFLYVFFGKGGAPEIDFANTCNQWDNGVFPGTNLADCSFMASDIKSCQQNGKIITLSLGGATGSVGFSSDSQAQSFARQIWDMFLGGDGDIRPFGNAVLDGVDLDIESGSSAHYAAFVKEIQSLSRGASKKFYVTAAPQCPFEDEFIGAALNSAPFDAVYVQFYNNFCELSAPSEFNFATWDNWAKHTSPNPNVKVYIGAPGSKGSAGEGYVSAATLTKMAQEVQAKYSSFGGIMVWDIDSTFSNNRFDRSIKSLLRAHAPPVQKTTLPTATKANPQPPKPPATSTIKPVVPISKAAPSPSVPLPLPTTARDPLASARVKFPTWWGDL